jgi:general secretion pathway protein D
MRTLPLLAITLLLTLSCASNSAFQKARSAETEKNWDLAVAEYEKAVEIDPSNTKFRISRDRARREASRVHFEKGKSLRSAANLATGLDQLRLAQLAATELELTVRLDPTNQFAANELSKAVDLINAIQRAAVEQVTVDDIKKRAQSAMTKAQPPMLNPASNDPITLTFSRDTNVKDIYRALGNAFGINVLFDQAVKDDRITIDLKDVTAQAALERVMQAANHFYKVLDEKTIIIVPDNPQARRDYEDLVIRTFYLSNGDAEQVTNVVRTMIEARNVFPLKALNAITIRDTADKVRIAEKIIQANDKAKSEVVVSVELVQIDLTRLRDIGLAITGPKNANASFNKLDDNGETILVDGKTVNFAGGTLGDIANTVGSLADIRRSVNLAIPTATYSLFKSLGNAELLASPELRISEGEKATLHIGQRIPVPVTTVAGYNPGSQQPGNSLVTPYTSFQYQDVGIKVAMEPRVHHNHEVTLKLTVEVSNQGDKVTFAGQEQPTFATRTIESTIRLKNGETNFLAGLIQSNRINSTSKTPFLGDLPFIGRLFSKTDTDERRTDLVLTMTPHIIRMPDITDEDLAPMWVGTGNNLTFRGVSPRIESQAGNGDPFVGRENPMGYALSSDGEPGNYIVPEGRSQQPVTPPPAGGAPNDPFRRNQPQPNPPVTPPTPPNPPDTSSEESAEAAGVANTPAAEAAAAPPIASATSDSALLNLAPRIAPQPSSIQLGPGETKVWSIIGMDIEGLTTAEMTFRFDPRAMDVTDIAFGDALIVDVASPPVITVDRAKGTITVKHADGKPLAFRSGGQILGIRVHGGLSGETFLVLENLALRNESDRPVIAAVAGGRARVE